MSEIEIAEDPTIRIMTPAEGFIGEAEWVRGDMQEKYVRSTSDTPWAEFAAIYRTNAQSAYIERQLIRHHIPYTVKGGSSFFARKEVYQMVFFLAAGWCNNLQAVIGYPEDKRNRIPGFQGIGNLPTLRFGKTTRWLGAKLFSTLDMIFKSDPSQGLLDTVRAWVNTLDSRARPGANDLADMLQNMRASVESGPQYDAEDNEMNLPHAALYWAFNNVYEAQLRLDTDKDEDAYDAKVASVRVLMEIAEDYSDIPSFVDYCLTRMVANSSKEEKLDSVKLMSIHASKGLEFKHVYVLGCNEGYLPHAKGDLHEELRLFYVACTRAMDTLTILVPEGYDFREQPLAPSPFLEILREDETEGGIEAP